MINSIVHHGWYGSPSTIITFHSDTLIVQEEISQGVTSLCATIRSNSWNQLTLFCIFYIDPFLTAINDPFSFFRIFSLRLLTFQLSHQWLKVIQYWTVEYELREVVQISVSVGSPDPRKNRLGKTHFRISHQSRCHFCLDPLL